MFHCLGFRGLAFSGLGDAFKFVIDGAAGGPVDGFVDAGVCAEVLPLRDGDFGSGFHQGQVFVLFLVGLLEHGPEVFLHLGGDGDGASLVVDGGVGCGRSEGEAVAVNLRADGAAQGAGADEMGRRAVALFRPLFAEEAASREVLVEVVEQLHAEVGEDVWEEVVGHNGFAVIWAQK